MARPLCDHCLTIFEDEPEVDPDTNLVCADAYLFTCDECSDVGDHPAADCRDLTYRGLSRDLAQAREQLTNPYVSDRFHPSITARIAWLEAQLALRG